MLLCTYINSTCRINIEQSLLGDGENFKLNNGSIQITRARENQKKKKTVPTYDGGKLVAPTVAVQDDGLWLSSTSRVRKTQSGHLIREAQRKMKKRKKRETVRLTFYPGNRSDRRSE